MTKIHIISHTHWDREWHRPFQYFRTKLVFVLDNILNILENDKDFSHYLLDGQSIVLDDYLAVKPQNAERIRKLVEDGRLIIGPWYIQPDEFAPDGESMIRNLLIGIQIAEGFGGSMKVGYLPDSFGQSGQMPHILKGFGIESAVMMRGIPAYDIQSSEFIWQGINGEEILGVYLPQGYSNAMFLPDSPRAARFRLAFTIRKLKKWASTENILIMNGVDHQFAQSHITRTVNELGKSKNRHYTISRIEEYIQAVQNESKELPTLSGDLLAPHKNRVHSSIASTRIYQKVTNRKLQTMLEKYVEPAAVMSWLMGAPYPGELINQAWKILLQNQTHDGLCGCCTDEVHREMDQRFVEVRQISDSLYNSYARATACSFSGKTNLLVYNHAMYPGKQKVSASVFSRSGKFTLKDMQGNQIPYQVENSNPIDGAKFSIWTLYLDTAENMHQVDITFETEFDCHVGFRRFEIHEKKNNPAIQSDIRHSEHTIENDLIRVDINLNGSLKYTDKETGQILENLLTFEDCGDAGDTYNYSPVKEDTVITSEHATAKISIHESPLQTEAEIDLKLSIPLELCNQDQQRSTETVDLPIKTFVGISPNSKLVTFKTTLQNHARDHRIRVCFPAGIQTDHSWAETQFGTARRANKIDTSAWKKQKWSEKPLPIYSQHRFVAVENNDQGLAIFNRGLPEYEIYENDQATIALTLLRGVGMMGKGDLLIRPGRPSGMEIPTPDAQCHGDHTLEYALMPFSGPIDLAHLHTIAAVYDAPAQAVQSRIKLEKIERKFTPLLKLIDLENLTSHIADQIQPHQENDFELIRLDDSNLLISAIKKAERGEALIIRLYNPSVQVVEKSHIQLGIETESAWVTDFNEQEKTALAKEQSNAYLLPALTPNSAITIKFSL